MGMIGLSGMARRDHGTTDMRHTIDIPNILTFKVRGHSVTLDLNNAATPDVASGIVARLALYGLRKFNDASPMGAIAPKDEAGKIRFAKECADNAREMVKDWLAGRFDTESVSDPVAREAMIIAAEYVKKKYGSPDHKDEAAKAEYIKRRNAAAVHPTIVEMARKAVEYRATLDIDV